MNKTIKIIYEEYRDDMMRTLGALEHSPHKFENLEYVEHFERKVDQLDTLIDLYANLLLASKN